MNLNEKDLKRIITLGLFALFFGIGLSPVKGQDVHFSQFYHSFARINPALTGIFNGDMRFSGNYRNQWSAVPVDYNTFNLFFDMKMMSKKPNNNNFGGFGILADYDQAGDSRLSLASLGLLGSYTVAFTDNVLLTGGVSVVGSQRRFNFDDLRTGRVNDVGEIEQVPFESSEDIDRFMNTSFFYMDLSAGLNLRLQKSSRTKVDFGIGAYHLNGPDLTFDDGQDESLSQRYAVTALGSVKLSEKFDLKLHGLGQFQEPFQELVGQVMGKMYLNNEFAKELALSLGVGYRYSGNDFNNAGSDAVYPTFQVDYRNLTVGLSYDMNISDFNVATNNRGGPEISVIYIFKKVKPLSQFKNCPIY